MKTHTLKGERFNARGRRTGETEVTLWRAGNHPSNRSPEVLISIGNREAYVNAADLRAAVEALVSTADMVGITYRDGVRVKTEFAHNAPCDLTGCASAHPEQHRP